MGDVMVSPALMDDLSQVRLDELSAKFIHQRLLRVPQWGVRIVDILTLIVPILYMAPKLIWTDQQALAVIGVIDTIMFVVLLASAITRKAFGWDDYLQGHRTAVTKNIRTSNQALELLTDRNASDDAARWFLRLAKEPDAAEERLLEGATSSQKQAAYRQALKEFFPASAEAKCQVCGASVWHHIKGTCQACGGSSPEGGQT